jgi:periplasmic protein TonB
MMKRNEKKVPRFDEIIFENRNKEYGAYDLRKRYQSVTSFSILGALAICSAIIIGLSLTTKPVDATGGGVITVVVQPEKNNPEFIKPPELKPPPELIKQPLNVTPEVVDDTTLHTTYIPITDVITSTTVNGDINDTMTYVEPPVDIVPAETKVFVIVEEPPMFPGGDNALLDYIRKNTIYPVEAVENNIEGRVILKFVVNPDGSVGKIELLKRVDPLLDQEAIRVVGTIPKFRPGKQSGVPVSVWYSVPVLFKIER